MFTTVQLKNTHLRRVRRKYVKSKYEDHHSAKGNKIFRRADSDCNDNVDEYSDCHRNSHRNVNPVEKTQKLTSFLYNRENINR